jgi:hypothetical protein
MRRIMDFEFRGGRTCLEIVCGPRIDAELGGDLASIGESNVFPAHATTR